MHPRHVLWLGNFFAASHYFLTVFIVGPYLASFVGEELAGLVIALGAVLSLLLFPFMPNLIRRFGAKKLAIGLGFTEAVILTVLAGNPTATLAIAAIALAAGFSPLIAYNLDLLLEATVGSEKETGRVRTAFITAANAALVLAPLAIGFLLDGTNRYDLVFFAAAVSLTPFIMLFLVEKIPEGQPPRASKLSATATCMLRDKDLRAVAVAAGTLQVFFHLAPFYIPIYLHTVLGIPWDTLGWMFAIMLLPFVLLEFPAGYLADKYLGDRKILVTGFALMGGAFAAFALVNESTPLALIVVVLVLTRVGAALVEAMVEGHFFRRVSERDVNAISVFRMLRPTGALIAPVLGSILLVAGGYTVLFVLLGLLITLSGVVAVHSMRDVSYDAKATPLPALPTSPSAASAASA